MPKRSLQIEEDLSFERRQWRVERAGWVLMAAFVLSALLGFFGSGVASWSTAGADGSLRLDYERFVRRGGTTSMTVSAPASAAQDGSFVLRLPSSYLDSVEIRRITPSPSATRSGDDVVVYEFDQQGDAPLSATFHLRPTGLWSVDGSMSVDGAGSVRFSHFMYP